MHARGLVKAWKKPRLDSSSGSSSSSLPFGLWSLVLEHMLQADSLWELPGTVQTLCRVSQTCKGLNLAVQRSGWPKLCRLLKPLRPTPLLMKFRGVCDTRLLVCDPSKQR